MKETKFTPGPWSTTTCGPHWNNPEIDMIEVNYGNDGECVCDTVYKMADAKLIASAPDMYSQLELYASLLGALIEDGMTGYESRKETVDKVLAKARGE